jgi:hypothetical protein
VCRSACWSSSPPATPAESKRMRLDRTTLPAPHAAPAAPAGQSRRKGKECTSQRMYAARPSGACTACRAIVAQRSLESYVVTALHTAVMTRSISQCSSQVHAQCCSGVIEQRHGGLATGHSLTRVNSVCARGHPSCVCSAKELSCVYCLFGSSCTQC